MPESDPEKLILASLLLTGGVLTWRGVRTGTLTPRVYAGLAVVAFGLLSLGAFAPALASALAVLILVAVLLSSQADLAALAGFGGGTRVRRTAGGTSLTGGVTQ